MNYRQLISWQWLSGGPLRLVVSAYLVATTLLSAETRETDCLIDLRFEGHFASEAAGITDVGFVLPFTGAAAPRFTEGVGGGRAVRFEPIGEKAEPTMVAFNPSSAGVAARMQNLASFTIAGWWCFEDVVEEPITLFQYTGERGYALQLTERRTLLFKFPDGSSAESNGIPGYASGKWIFLGASYRGGERPTIEFHAGHRRTGGECNVISAHLAGPSRIEVGLGAPRFGDDRHAWKGAMDSVKFYGSATGPDAALGAEELAAVAGQHASRLPVRTVASRLRKSDVVIMRSDSAAPAVEYGATRIAWNYQVATGLVEGYAALGIAFSQTLNLLNQRPLTIPLEAGRTADFDGRPVYHHHVKSVPHPAPVTETREDILAHYRQTLLRTGAASIQNDNPMMDRHANYLGAGIGFDLETLVGFKEYLRKNNSVSDLRERFAISDIEAFDYRNWLRINHGITDGESYREKYRLIPLARELEFFQEDRIRELLTDLRDLCHAQVPAIQLSANVLNQQIYYRGLLTSVDYFCSETPRALSGTKLDAQDVILSKFAEAVGRDMIAVNGHTWTNAVMTRNAVNLNLLLAATVYAHGQIMMAPWNIWAGYDSAVQAHRRYFGDPKDHAPMFQWIREQERYFDFYEELTRVALLWNCDTSMRSLDEPARELLARHVPFSVLPLGGRYPESGIDVAGAAERFAAVGIVGRLEDWSERDRMSIRRLGERARLVSPNELKGERPLLDVKGVGAENIWLSPRRHSGDGNAPIVLHLLNRRYQAEDDSVDRSPVEIAISAELLGFEPHTTVTWSSFESGSREVRFESGDGWHRVALPELPLWSILIVHRPFVKTGI